MNYIWTFSGAKHGKAKGLVSFMGIGAAGLVITLGIMALLVEFFGVHYLIARIIAAIVTLLWNYILNSLVTFK
jgi:putative flippase GtrA